MAMAENHTGLQIISRMLNIPAIHQRLVIEDDMIIAQNFFKLADGLAEFVARYIGWQARDIVLAQRAFGKSPLRQEPIFGLGSDFCKPFRDARVLVGEERRRGECGAMRRSHV